MKLHYFNWLLAASIIFVFSNCKDDESIPTDCTDVQWEYEGADGPSNWDILCTGFADCGETNQSPIDITGATMSTVATTLTIDYLSSATNIKNNGHTVEYTMDHGSTVTIDGTVYDLAQLHFHALSEHTVDGQHYPMEVHLVHQEQGGTALAVIAIFFQEGAENAFLASQLANIPTMEDETFTAADQIQAGDLFPAEIGSFYRYTGSLTTPPCSEIVSWMVMKNPIEASASQLSSMSPILDNNYRPVQPLNGRELLEFN